MRSDRYQSGMALVATLAAILLVTIAVVATLSNSKNFAKWSVSSENRSSAVTLTRGVAHVIASEYQKQIVATGALESSLPEKVEGLTILTPQNSSRISSAIPYRTVLSSLENNSDFANLIGQSLPSKPLFPNGATPYNQTEVELALPEGASAVSSSTPAKNDRFVSGTRWSSPKLLTDGAEFEKDQVPYWIYLNREGSALSQDFSQELTQRQSANPDFALGRFAFNVYDVGALLDANVAGYDSSSSTDAKFKGGQSWADLTAIPGFNSSKISNFLRWRNPKGLSNYLSTVENWLGPRGFLLPYRPGSQGDRFFGSRQDMIRFHLSHPESLPEEALPYLTHWTRSVDQPSYIPSTVRPKVAYNLASGGNDAFGKEEEINPNINQFYDSKGNPLMKTRFPLSRLDLVANNIQIPNGPTEDKVDKIYKYFGLKWDQANNQWIYKHGDGDTGNRILELSEIPQEGGKWSREPDFFEVLKAAIGVGSLGKQAVIDIKYFSNPIQLDSTLKHAMGKQDGQIDQQIMRIGACIIDQYGSEGYPSRILFGSTLVYGLKNLPLLYSMILRHYQGEQWTAMRTNPLYSTFKKMTLMNSDTLRNNIPNTLAAYVIASMLQPIIWNPHRPSETEIRRPTKFRIVADSNGIGCQMLADSWKVTSDMPNNSLYTANYTDPGMEGPDLSGQTIIYTPNNAYIEFNTTTTGAASFREPRTLASLNYPAGSNTTTWPNNPDYKPSLNNITDISLPDTVFVGSNYNEFGRISTGTGNNPDPLPLTNRTYIGFKLGVFANLNSGTNRAYMGSPIRIILQYEGPDGKFYSFDEIPQAMFKNSYTGTIGKGPVAATWNGQMLHINARIDPRTDRWGGFIGYVTNGGIGSDGKRGANEIQYGRSLWPSSFTNPGTVGVGNSGGYIISTSLYKPRIAQSGWSIPPQTQGPNAAGSIVVNLLMGDFQRNNGNTKISSTPWSYKDPDDVLRYADGSNAMDEEGLPMTTVSKDPQAMGAFPPAAINPDYDSRPVMLNRPFRSVAELGQVFRDLPWKSLDLTTPQSGDAALLDYFTLYEPETTHPETSSDNSASPLTGAVLSPNGGHPEVYQAMIQGTAKNSSVQISNEEAKAISQALVKWTQSREKEKGPFQNRAELVGKYIGSNRSTNASDYTGFLSSASSLLSGKDSAIKSKRESILRGLTDSCNTRTWNLMIDVIGQTGRFSKDATNLKEFEVAGESRYWFFVSIDRYTGKIIDSSFELVTE